jgi:hypothetical protein
MGLPSHSRTRLVDPVDVLNEGQLQLETSLGDRRADRLAELGDDGLLDLADRVDGGDAATTPATAIPAAWNRKGLHGCSPVCRSRFKSGRMLPWTRRR